MYSLRFSPCYLVLKFGLLGHSKDSFEAFSWLPCVVSGMYICDVVRIVVKECWVWNERIYMMLVFGNVEL